MGRVDIPTIFFGGGTPSLMPAVGFEKIINAISKNFNPPPECEITLESNPGTMDRKKLDEFIAAGVNRLSVGVQSLDDEKLKFLGRRHSAAAAIELLRNAADRKIRVSADFIYGLPGETTKDIISTCREINKIGLRHCSMYELTIEPETVFGKMNLDMPSDAEMADMYNAIQATLALPRYEISNYAAPGYECIHNQNIWAGAPYIGIGQGAAGRPYINNQWYEQRGAGELYQPLSASDRAAEKLITGLRTTRGIRVTDDINAILNSEYARRANNYIQIDNGYIRATKSGMLILDNLLVKLIK